MSLVDNVLGLLQGSYTVRYNYAVGLTPRSFTVSHSSGSRFAALNNNANGFYVSTGVTLNQLLSIEEAAQFLTQGLFICFTWYALIQLFTFCLVLLPPYCQL